jgi:hypothetical protein
MTNLVASTHGGTTAILRGVPRTVGGIRVLGIVFAIAGASMVTLGVLDLFGVIDLTPNG